MSEQTQATVPYEMLVRLGVLGQRVQDLASEAHASG